jgi:hypothetical protein
MGGAQNERELEVFVAVTFSGTHPLSGVKVKEGMGWGTTHTDLVFTSLPQVSLSSTVSETEKTPV